MTRKLNTRIWTVWTEKVELDMNTNYHPRVTWLKEKFGSYMVRWYVVNNDKTVKYYFKNREDAVMFSLRWS